ncbi:Aspartic peptidase domain containing protein, partial [Parasponia andersonii]
MDITFTEQDAREVHYPHNNALVVKINCGSTQLWRGLVDNGSAVDILYFDAFKKMGLNESDLKPAAAPLYGFTRDSLMPMGMIELMVSVGTFPRVSSIMTQFLVVDCPSTFNAILGRPTLRELRAVTSIYHLTMKFPTQH